MIDLIHMELQKERNERRRLSDELLAERSKGFFRRLFDS